MIILKGVREYCEGMEVGIKKTKGEYIRKDNPRDGEGRLVIVAKNEAGYNSTEVDLIQLLEWVAKNMPDEYCECAGELIDYR